MKDQPLKGLMGEVIEDVASLVYANCNAKLLYGR